MKTRILIAFIVTAASLCFAKQTNNFTVIETKTGLEISEAGKKVCAYRKIPDSKKLSRSHYFHPVYDLSENVLTEDFPADHLHHHGLWWAWHQIRQNGKQISDGWMMDNIHLDVKKLTHSSMQDGGLLVIMNVDWLTNDNKLLVKELSEAVFHPAEKHYRIIDFNIILSSDGTIEIGGSDNVKGYGGFSLRLKEMENLEFSDRNGKVKPENTAVNAGEWMNFTWPSGEMKSGVVIMCHETKPDKTAPWILRSSKSMQNPVFPGQKCVPIPKDGLNLKYRVVIHDATLNKKQIQKIYDNYKPAVQVEGEVNSSVATCPSWLEERTVNFPEDRSVGMLKTRKWNPVARHPDEDLVEARGKVQIPAGYMLGLEPARDKPVDLSPLANLKPNDLQNLYLYRTQVADADLRHISRLTGLKQIGLGMTNIGDEGLAHIAGLKSLKELNIAQTKITDAGLIHLAKLSELETLSLMNNSITNKGLIQLRGLKKLKHLILTNTKITDQGLFHLNKLKSLKSLTLSNTDIDGSGLLQLRDMSSLEWLKLTSTSTNDAILMHIGTMKNLKGLYLNKTNITDTGIEFLKNLNQLEQLLLMETKITDNALKHLAELSKLKYLNLNKTSVSKSALKTLMQALPNCRIMHSEMQSLNIPVLIGQLGDKDGMKRSIAINDLARIGKPAVGALIEALKDENPEARKTAARALGLMGPDAKDAIGALVDVLKGEDKSLYVFAGYSLVKIEGPPFPMTMGLLKDGKTPVRRAIVENLVNFGSKAVALLIHALKDKDLLVRNYACWGLGNIGPEAKDAIGPLTLMTQDDDKNVRHQAVEALKKIKPTVQVDVEK